MKDLLKNFPDLRRLVKSIFLIVVLLTLLILGLVIGSGYLLFGPDPCSNWQPSMTKDQKIVMALKHANNASSLSFEFINAETGEKYRSLIKQVPYENIGTILSQQPDCCNVYAQDSALTDYPKPVDETLGGDEGVVVLSYLGKYEDRQTGAINTAPTFTYLNLNICKQKIRGF